MSGAIGASGCEFTFPVRWLVRGFAGKSPNIFFPPTLCMDLEWTESGSALIEAAVLEEVDAGALLLRPSGASSSS
jgi:hypothetical protein